MAKLKVVNQKEKYHDINAKTDLLHYVLNPNKSFYIGYAHVNPEYPAESMMAVSEQFGKSTGVQLRHYILAFSSKEVKFPQVANEIAWEIIRYFGQTYQAVFAVHENTENLHIHFIFNSVSFVDGHRHYGKRAEFYQELTAMQRILRHYGIRALQYIPSCKTNPDEAPL